MSDQKHNDPLHGLSLKAILTDLVEHYGWEDLGQRIRINCFKENPSMKSSLTFLRKTPWAREKVENLYLWTRKKKIPRHPEPPSKENNLFAGRPNINPWTGKPYEES